MLSLLIKKDYEKNEWRHFLMQQGFFQDELSIPRPGSRELQNLLSCARNYVSQKEMSRNPLVYLEAISYCVLRKSYDALEASQQRAVASFAEHIGHRSA